MKVILLEEVKSLGKKGTIVTVNDNYARNFLIPKGLGKEASKANLNDLKLHDANEAKLEAAKRANALDMKKALEGKTIDIKIKVGKDGKAFGSVTNKEVADAINKSFGIDIDKKKITMDAIKEVGKRELNLKLHKEITAKIKVNIIGEE